MSTDAVQRAGREDAPRPHAGGGRIDVLGPLRWSDDDGGAPPTGRAGALLHELLVRVGHPVAVPDLVEALWPGVDVAVGRRRLHLTASRLRARLPATIGLTTSDAGYRLSAPPQAIDRLEFEALARRADAGDLAAARDALALWRDQPYLGFAVTESLRRERRRLLAMRSRLEALLGGEQPPPPRDADGPWPGAITEPLDEHVERIALLDRLPQAGEARLLALTAPSGYGKTVLLRQWARRQVGPVVRLSSGDHGGSAGLDDTIRRALRDDASPEGGLVPPERAGPGELTDLLHELPPATALVLDDLQDLTDPADHATLHQIVQRCPTHVTVAVASRQALPFPTGRFATQGDVCTLVADDLAFTAEELAAATQLPDDDTRARRRWRQRLQAITEGWPEPAVAIAAAVPDASQVPPCPDLTDVLPTERFLARVLADVPVELRAFLRDTAHLSELDPDLCRAVTGDAAAHRTLSVLASRHQLIASRDGRYRHRRPLASALLHHRRRRWPAALAGGHARAARWYLGQRRPERALDHAAAAGDRRLVDGTLVPAVRGALSSANADALSRWAATIAPADGLDTEALEATALCAALMPRSERRSWDPAGRPDAPPVLLATLDAVDLARAGRWRRSQERVVHARELLRRDAVTHPRSIEALLAIAEEESRLLVGDEREAGTSLPRRVDEAGWPWLTLWAYGQQALRAYAAGDVGLSGAVLEHARHRVGPLHGSWASFTDGSACVTDALVALHRAPEPEQVGRTVDRLDALVDRLDRDGRVPIATVARYALHLAHRRLGDAASADRRLAEADAASEALPELGLLRVVRARLVERAAADERPTSASLSPRERVVLHHLDSDLTLAQIADVLHVSAHTVRAQTRSIYRKLGVSHRSEAVAHGADGPPGAPVP